MATFADSRPQPLPNPGRPRVSKRPDRSRPRKLLALGLGLILLALAAAVNYGPLCAYLDARARWTAATSLVERLEQERQELQGRMGKLLESSYLEELARRELGYARPGEEVYIVVDSLSDQDALSGTVRQASGDEAVPSRSGGEGSEPADVSSARPGLFEGIALKVLGIFGSAGGD